MTDEHHDHDEARSKQRGALHELAEANSEATWGDSEVGTTRVPGVLSGDVGPKGKISAQLRSLSRSERSRMGEVPRGTIVDGTGRYILLAMMLIVAVLVAIVAFIWWIAS